MCMLRWPDTVIVLQISSPYPLYWVRLPLILPGILLTIFPDLWVEVIALRVRVTPAAQPTGQPEQAQQAWDLRPGSRISRRLDPACHLLDPHSTKGQDTCWLQNPTLCPGEELERGDTPFPPSWEAGLRISHYLTTSLQEEVCTPPSSKPGLARQRL